MIKGMGIDIIEINRIAYAVAKRESFLKRVFTEGENQYFHQRNYHKGTIAGSFAAKEAIVKALGTGLRGFQWIDIELMRDELGKPHVILHNGAKAAALERGIDQVMVTISHSKEYAVAQAVAL